MAQSLQPSTLTNLCLLAPPALDDPEFERAVVLVARHDAEGALGLIINQPSLVALRDLLDDLSINNTLVENNLVMRGGPVRPEVGFVMHTGQPVWHSSIAVSENICVTTSRDVLEAIAGRQGVDHYQIMLGYASWEAGQLEGELARGDWIVCLPDMQLLFNLPPHLRWQAAADKIGINSAWLADHIGHA